MKKKQIIFAWILPLILIGCSGKQKATDKIEFYLLFNTQEQQVIHHVVYTYNDEDMISCVDTATYSGLGEVLTRDKTFQGYRILENALFDIRGVEVKLETTDAGYTYEEIWDYSTVNVEYVTNIDERQLEFIKDGKYDIDRIKEYYGSRGYSNSTEKIE